MIIKLILHGSYELLLFIYNDMVLAKAFISLINQTMKIMGQT
jgi:hypothetical protein